MRGLRERGEEWIRGSEVQGERKRRGKEEGRRKSWTGERIRESDGGRRGRSGMRDYISRKGGRE